MSIRFIVAAALPLISLSLLGCPSGDDDDDTIPAEIEGDEAGECDDGVDNDQDGLTDCDDDGCGAATACVGDDDTGDDDSAGDDDDDTTGAGCAPCGGTYVVENSSQLDEVALCESISGSLTVSHADWFTSLDLPCLVTVGGNVVIDDNSAMTTIEMPLLATVDGALNIT